jgi:hypothetical protein
MSSLTPEPWQALSPYLDQALTLSGEERSRWLQSLRTENPVLASQLQELLQRDGLHIHSVLWSLVSNSDTPTLVSRTLSVQIGKEREARVDVDRARTLLLLGALGPFRTHKQPTAQPLNSLNYDIQCVPVCRQIESYPQNLFRSARSFDRKFVTLGRARHSLQIGESVRFDPRVVAAWSRTM